jgi:hypothetical protein
MTRLRALILVAMLAACSTSRTTSGSLPPVESSQPVAKSGEPVTTSGDGVVAVATMGEPAKFEQVSITATNPVVGGDKAGPWLTVTFHLDNATNNLQEPISLSIYCSGNPKSGGWQVGSTLNPTAGVSANAVADGTINLMLPGDTRSGTQRPACATPARLIGQGTSGQAVAWDLPDALIATMNAAP